MNETLSSTILKGMNNPDCAFFVGKMWGESTIINITITIALIGLIYKAISVLAWEPFLVWLKTKFRGGGKNVER